MPKTPATESVVLLPRRLFDLYLSWLASGLLDRLRFRGHHFVAVGQLGPLASARDWLGDIAAAVPADAPVVVVPAERWADMEIWYGYLQKARYSIPMSQHEWDRVLEAEPLVAEVRNAVSAPA